MRQKMIMTIHQGITKRSISINNGHDHVRHLMTITEIGEIVAAEPVEVVKNPKSVDLPGIGELRDHPVTRHLRSENITITSESIRRK